MKTQPSSYAILIDSLAEDGLQAQSKELDVLLRHVAWTTGSEFMGEFGQTMKEIKASQWSQMSDKTRRSFKSAADEILKVWPEIGL